MAQAAKKLKKVEEVEQAIPKSGHSPYWESTLFNDVYLENDVPVKYKMLWEEDESGPFYEFCNQFRNLCEELKDTDFDSWSERNTINRFIKPVLKMLGYTGTATQDPWAEDEPFSVKENGESKTYKPDLIIVNDPKELKYIEKKKGDDKLEEARSSVILPIEAKYWGRIEDIRQSVKEDSKRSDKKDQPDSTRSLDFDEQCLKYMEILNKDFGILTDGRTWRLYHKELSSDSYKRNYQFNLGYLVKHVNNGLDKDHRDYDIFVENAKYFFHFFSKQALFSSSGDRRFVDDLLEYSKKYVALVEDDLKDRFVKAMTIACNGYMRSSESKKPSSDLAMIRNVSESHLFNILFIRYCESRNILPMKVAEYRKISISSTIDKLEFFSPEKETDNLNYLMLKRVFSGHFPYDPSGTELYDRLLDLTQKIQNGVRPNSTGFEIKKFQRSIFTPDEWSFAQNNKLSNSEMVSILFELGYCESDLPGRKIQQIPYSFFSPRQLGSIYESFLEFRLERASEDMAFIKKQWVPANLESDKIRRLDVSKAKKGRLIFCPDNKDRKVTGSYYTPDCVVQFIVQETLAPLVQGRKPHEIEKMRVCDPAMGSSHFLGASLNYLGRAYLEAVERETNDDLKITLVQAKRKLLHSCIFGADVNPRAVKLAKMSLWLETAEPGEPLEDLDDQIKQADSLTNEFLWKSEWKFLSSGIDAVVGNPPYLGESGHKEVFRPIATSWLGKKYYQGKMDLLYFFFHLGIEILKPNGRLGFITTNYFTTASGAVKLRKSLNESTNIDLLLNLNEMKVFGEAAGQHNMITLLTKTDKPGETKCIYTDERKTISSAILRDIFNGENGKTSAATIKKSELYEGGELVIVSNKSISGSSSSSSILDRIKNADTTLAKIFDINQGVVSGANKVSQKSIEKFGIKGASHGAGVFVLTKEELQSLNLSKQEAKEFVRPFFKNSQIGKFETQDDPHLFLLYISRSKKNIPSKVREHLKKFKPLLESRREVQNGVIDWFQLQWPREEAIFEGPKVVLPYRAKLNNFGYNESAWYAATDVYFITTNPKKSKHDLFFVLGLLNSELYLYWFSLMGKRKGSMLELFQKPLCELPVKIPASKEMATIVAATRDLVNGYSDVKWRRLNSLIYDLYGLNKSEQKEVERFYIAALDAAKKSEDIKDDNEDAA